MATVFPPSHSAFATATSTVYYDYTSTESSLMSANTRELLNEELRRMLSPISEGLNCDILDTTKAAESFTLVLRDQLIHHCLLEKESQEDKTHRDRAVIRTTLMSGSTPQHSQCRCRAESLQRRQLSSCRQRSLQLELIWSAKSGPSSLWQ